MNYCYTRSSVSQSVTQALANRRLRGGRLAVRMYASDRGGVGAAGHLTCERQPSIPLGDIEVRPRPLFP